MTLKKSSEFNLEEEEILKNFKKINQNPNMNSIVLFLVDIYLSLSRSVDQSLNSFIFKMCLVISTSKLQCED